MTDTRFDNLRALEFSGTERAIYLNAASFGPLPDRVRSTLNEFNNKRHRNELRDADLKGTLGLARASAARLINCTPEEIALVPNTSFAINIAANALLDRPANETTVLISDGEFPANVYPWLALQEQGFTVDIVPTDARGFPDEDAMMERIATGNIAALSISFVQFANGWRADLKRLGAACRRYGTLFVVDAIQGVGACPLDVDADHIDILACGAQKWLCSPWGSGFTFVKRELITSFKPVLPGWLSFKSSLDFNNLLNYEYDLLDDARRFETGSLAFQDQLGMAHSIDLLMELGIDRIEQHVHALQEPIIEWARYNDVEIVSDLSAGRRSGILCIRPRHAEKAYQSLVAANVACAFRENSIRLSPHWYNTHAEVERVLEVLDQSV